MDLWDDPSDDPDEFDVEDADSIASERGDA